jgi:predicted molibdopterin-dependent oxidoreductase YjgC
VQDSYLDVETTQYAHIFLPAAIWAEKEGVFTNTERRVNIIRKIKEPYADSKPDLYIFNRLAERFEQSSNMNFPDNFDEVFEEMRVLSKGRFVDISGMTHDLIEKHRGIQWPYTEEQAAKGEPPQQGGKRLYTEPASFRYADGRAKLIPLPFINNNEVPDAQYPFWLNSGRLVEHFHSRTRTGKIGNNNKFSPIPFMEMNPDAAEPLNIKHQTYVRVISRRGDAIVMVMLTQRIPSNMVFIPFHFFDCVNRLTLGLLDPHSRQPAFKQSAVMIEHVDQRLAAQLNKESREY